MRSMNQKASVVYIQLYSEKLDLFTVDYFLFLKYNEHLW